jgi:hypothetical protein
MRRTANVNRLALVVISVVVVVVAGVSYFLLPSANQGSQSSTFSSGTGGESSTTSTLASQPSCANADPIDYSFPPTLDKLPVLVSQPGSTIVVCVTYQASWLRPNVTYADIQSAFFPNGVYTFPAPQITQTVPVGPNTTALTYKVSHSFTITYQPTSITPTIDTTTVTIMYSITPPWIMPPASMMASGLQIMYSYQ